MGTDWEWFEPSNPGRLFIVKTEDLRLEILRRNFSLEDLNNWVASQEDTYRIRCAERKKKNKYFTFSDFNDLLEFVKLEGYIPGFVRVMIEKNGDMTVAHGMHRWAAAYIAGIKEVPARLCKRI